MSEVMTVTGSLVELLNPGRVRIHIDGGVFVDLPRDQVVSINEAENSVVAYAAAQVFAQRELRLEEWLGGSVLKIFSGRLSVLYDKSRLPRPTILPTC